MISAIVWGAGGRMGGRCIQALINHRDFRLVAAVEHPDHQGIGSDSGTFHHLTSTGILITSDSAIPETESPGVIIDFSLSGGPQKAALFAAARKVALVSGTTALSESDIVSLKTSACQVPIVQSPNFSLGINMLLRSIRMADQLLPDIFEAAIVELHHKAKKDKPSGTAKALANEIRTNGRLKDIAAIRAGSIVGEHEVRFVSESEEITFTHKALNRDLFVHGALIAAKWVVEQPPGLYSMDDVLGKR